jgi:hypothetical protein
MHRDRGKTMNNPNPEKVTELIKELTSGALTVTHKQLVREAIGHKIAQYCPRSVFMDYWDYIKLEEDRDKLIAELYYLQPEIAEELNQEVRQ